MWLEFICFSYTARERNSNRFFNYYLVKFIKFNKINVTKYTINVILQLHVYKYYSLDFSTFSFVTVYCVVKTKT